MNAEDLWAKWGYIVNPAEPIWPMLASGGDWRSKIGDPEWVAEEKFDGVRYLVHVWQTPGVPEDETDMNEGLNVRIFSRAMKDKTDRMPQVVSEFIDLARRNPLIRQGAIFDGEVVAESFERTLAVTGSLASRGMHESVPYRFMVFDLPYFAGQSMEHITLNTRRMALENLIHHRTAAQVVQLTPQEPVTEEGLDRIWDRGGEGIIVKRLSGPYVRGERPRETWIKVKMTDTAEGVITGFREGRGKYSDTIGAVCISQWRDGQLVEVAAAGGMTDEVRREIGSNREEYLGKVVEFKYQRKTEGKYRHPRWSRMRPDRTPESCKWE